MGRLALSIAASLGLAAAMCQQLAAAQNDRDFVFTDDEGYLVIRFVRMGPQGLNETQRDEVLDQEFSTMIHDRLRADLRFEDEPIDSNWAAWAEPEIQKLIVKMPPGFSSVNVQCRSASCRIVLEHPSRLSIAEHQSLMGTVEGVIQEFVDANPSTFDPAFMMTAYDQESETPHVKAFIRRTGRP
jgi:hypothetical protein